MFATIVGAHFQSALRDDIQIRQHYFKWALPFKLRPPLPPPSPKRARWSFFSAAKNDVLARITERSKDDYDNDVSDNCDNNFGTFDDFGVKNDQKVSHNMILMSKYKGQHGGKKGKQIRARPSPPLFGQGPKENVFFYERCSLILRCIYRI